MNHVEVPHCCTICDAKKLCHVCRTPTLYACADCQIDLGTTIYVCPTAACRDAHERSCPSVLRSKLAAGSAPAATP